MPVSLRGILLFPLLLAAADERPSLVDRVVVHKHERKLVLLSAGRELKSYRVALGGEPVGPKTRRGDHRTLEEIYFLDSRNPHSRFY